MNNFVTTLSDYEDLERRIAKYFWGVTDTMSQDIVEQINKNTQKEMKEFEEYFNGNLDFTDVIPGIMKFDKSKFYFNRSIKDTKPYVSKHFDDKDVIIYEAVGMSKDDITVEQAKDKDKIHIFIKGKVKEGILSDFKYDLGAELVYNSKQVDKIEAKLKDGLLYLSVFYKHPEEFKAKPEEKKKELKKEKIDIKYEN